MVVVGVEHDHGEVRELLAHYRLGGWDGCCRGGLGNFGGHHC